jgi:uncharacterized RDD family membrane protein YckC
MRYAPFYKRFLASLVDLSVIYFSHGILSFLIESQMNDIFPLTFGLAIFYQSIFYVSNGQTLGEKYLGLRVIIESEKINKKTAYFYRAVLKTIVFVPFGLSYVSLIGAILLVINSLLIQIDEKIRQKKLLVWDVAFRMAVIEKE